MRSKSGVNRLIGGTKSIGVVSAFRSAYGLADNLSRTRELQRDLEDAGAEFHRVYGHYAEDGRRRKREISFAVISDDPFWLEGLVRSLGAKYNQDSVIIKTGSRARLVGTSDADEEGSAIEFPGKGREVELEDSDMSSFEGFISRVSGRDFKVESSSLCTFGEFLAGKTIGG